MDKVTRATELKNKRDKALSGKDLSDIKKFPSVQHIDAVMKVFDDKAATATPKQAFLHLFSQRTTPELMAAKKFLEAKSDGGRTDRKIANFGKLLLGRDMEVINNLFDTSASFIEAIELSMTLAFEKIGEQEKFDLGDMKKLLGDYVFETMESSMKD